MILKTKEAVHRERRDCADQRIADFITACKKIIFSMENLPKGMLSFMGQTIIERQILLYRKCGIQDIIVVRGFAADKIIYEGVTYYTNEDYENACRWVEDRSIVEIIRLTDKKGEGIL